MASKNSTKVTFDNNTNTLKVRFRNLHGAVNHVKIYTGNEGEKMVSDIYRWNRFSLTPGSIDGIIFPKTIDGKAKKMLMN